MHSWFGSGVHVFLYGAGRTSLSHRRESFYKGAKQKAEEKGKKTIQTGSADRWVLQLA